MLNCKCWLVESRIVKAKIGLPDVPEAKRSLAFELLDSKNMFLSCIMNAQTIPLRRIAEALVSRKADLAAKVGGLKDRKDAESIFTLAFSDVQLRAMRCLSLGSRTQRLLWCGTRRLWKLQSTSGARQ